MEKSISFRDLEKFENYLIDLENSPGTIENYIRHAKKFFMWLDGQDVSREIVTRWKSKLAADGYMPTTINNMLVSVNSFLDFLGMRECRVKTLRLQRKLFRSENKELNKEEYERLCETAIESGKERLALIIETICSTGIRVSEIKYITVEAVKEGRAEISLKGKVRTILLPGKLCRKLRHYIKKKKISSGEIFLTRSGKGISRKQIWTEMKNICQKAGVSASKVFPHNLRHLFARIYYKISKDMAKLSDILGHSSIETTRIYLISTGAEHAKQLEMTGLIL